MVDFVPLVRSSVRGARKCVNVERRRCWRNGVGRGRWRVLMPMVGVCVCARDSQCKRFCVHILHNVLERCVRGLCVFCLSVGEASTASTTMMTATTSPPTILGMGNGVRVMEFWFGIFLSRSLNPGTHANIRSRLAVVVSGFQKDCFRSPSTRVLST